MALPRIPDDVIIEILKRADIFVLCELVMEDDWKLYVHHTRVRITNQIFLIFSAEENISIQVGTNSKTFPDDTDELRNQLMKVIRGAEKLRSQHAENGPIFSIDTRCVNKFKVFVDLYGREKIKNVTIYNMQDGRQHKGSLLEISHRLPPLDTLHIFGYYPWSSFKQLHSPPKKIRLFKCQFNLKKFFEIESPFIEVITHNFKKLEKIVRKWTFDGFPHLRHLKITSSTGTNRLMEKLASFPNRIEPMLHFKMNHAEVHGFMYQARNGQRAIIGFDVFLSMHIIVV